MKQFGICRNHGVDIELLVICKHLMETKNIKYININNEIMLCEECFGVKPSELSPSYGRTICIKCFEELKLQNNLKEVTKQ